MKKLLIFVVIIVLAAVVVVQFNGSFHADPDELTLAEATFSVRAGETSDATKFLVGKFVCEDGSTLVFDGMGGVVHYAINLAETKGSYSLTESKDGAAVVRMDIGKGPALYTFKIVSPQGEFTLTDAANISHKFVPTA